MAAKPPVALSTPAPPAAWAQFKRAPGLVLGFHGCDKATAERVLSGAEPHLRPSTNRYDWLGAGIYFWESDPWRAWQFAHEARANGHLTQGRIEKPFVLGAIIDLGHCCNLLEVAALEEVHDAHAYLELAHKTLDSPMPANEGRAMGLRYLDRAVLETMHSLRSRRALARYDSVRAAFIEGASLYPRAGFNRKNHIQLAVCNEACIKGYFRLPEL
jgi:hypothetical protein